MGSMNNVDIRILIAEKGLKHKDIAKQMGISPEWLSRLLRHDLDKDYRERIIKAIDNIEIEQDSHLAKMTEEKAQQEKIEFFESCERRISNAVETLNVCLDMINQMANIRDQVQCDMQDMIRL